MISRRVICIAVLFACLSSSMWAFSPGRIFDCVADFRFEWLKINAEFRDRVVSVLSTTNHQGADWEQWNKAFLFQLDHWHSLVFGEIYDTVLELHANTFSDKQQLQRFLDDYVTSAVDGKFFGIMSAFLSPLFSEGELHDTMLHHTLDEYLQQLKPKTDKLREIFIKDLLQILLSPD